MITNESVTIVVTGEEMQAALHIDGTVREDLRMRPFLGFSKNGGFFLGVQVVGEDAIIRRSEMDRPVLVLRAYREMRALSEARAIDQNAQPVNQQIQLGRETPPQIEELVRLLLGYRIPISVREITMEMIGKIPPTLGQMLSGMGTYHS